MGRKTEAQNMIKGGKILRRNARAKQQSVYSTALVLFSA